MARPVRILVLGIGNLLWADEGFGVRAAEAFDERYHAPENVTVLDGGTQGLYLLPYLEEADALIVFDAVDYGLEPGTMKLVRDDDVPAFLGARKMSLHQTGFQEVIATAELLDRHPPHLLLIGVQPLQLEDYGGGLTPPIEQCITPAIELAAQELREKFGIHLGERTGADEAEIEPGFDPERAQAQAARALRRELYEGQRPSAEDACRIGDIRFLATRDA